MGFFLIFFLYTSVYPIEKLFDMHKASHTAPVDIFENSFGLHIEDLYPIRRQYPAYAQKTLRLPYHIHSTKSRLMQQSAELRIHWFSNCIHPGELLFVNHQKWRV